MSYFWPKLCQQSGPENTPWWGRLYCWCQSPWKWLTARLMLCFIAKGCRNDARPSFSLRFGITPKDNGKSNMDSWSRVKSIMGVLWALPILYELQEFGCKLSPIKNTWRASFFGPRLFSWLDTECSCISLEEIAASFGFEVISQSGGLRWWSLPSSHELEVSF